MSASRTSRIGSVRPTKNSVPARTLPKVAAEARARCTRSKVLGAQGVNARANLLQLCLRRAGGDQSRISTPWVAMT